MQTPEIDGKKQEFRHLDIDSQDGAVYNKQDI